MISDIHLSSIQLDAIRQELHEQLFRWTKQLADLEAAVNDDAVEIGTGCRFDASVPGMTQPSLLPCFPQARKPLASIRTFGIHGPEDRPPGNHYAEVFPEGLAMSDDLPMSRSIATVSTVATLVLGGSSVAAASSRVPPAVPHRLGPPPTFGGPAPSPR